ncbi:MAG TPA: hypothetical protein VE687_17790, partial [Stellaceae bacterium]|nr:hypothetical protein [Stellaceae bacterium]
MAARGVAAGAGAEVFALAVPLRLSAPARKGSPGHPPPPRFPLPQVGERGGCPPALLLGPRWPAPMAPGPGLAAGAGGVSADGAGGLVLAAPRWEDWPDPMRFPQARAAGLRRAFRSLHSLRAARLADRRKNAAWKRFLERRY